MKCLILYWSAGGNTKKTALAIQDELLQKSAKVDLVEITEELEINLHDYDVVFLGSPSYQWIPPLPVQKFMKKTMNTYRGGVRPVKIPKVSGKFSVVFCTFGGIHTGIKEGLTAGSYMAQFLEHMGFFVLDKWYVPGKFQGWDDGSINGKLGNILNRPDENDLKIIRENTDDIVSGLSFML